MPSRPNDENLRRFASKKDTDSVVRLFECARQHLSALDVEWQDAEPFPATRENLGTFAERNWRSWILSVSIDDGDGIEALRRFTRTCAMRLGETVQPTDDLLQLLINSPQERLGVELKPWLIPSEADGTAKIAKACLALRNNNGGHLLLGFNDDGTPAQGPPENVTGVYHVDSIQGIVSKYASDPFAITVEYRSRQGQTHPIFVVPEGVVTPVFSKSALFDPKNNEKCLIHDDVIYVRSVSANNRVSSTKIRKSDIDRLIKICFDNREADIGAFIRRHLAGIAPEILKTALLAVRQAVEPEITPTMIIERGYYRFHQAAIEAGQHLPDVGYWECAAVVNGLERTREASRELLYRLRAIRRDHSGLPPWTVIDNPNVPAWCPRVVDGTWEAIVIETSDEPSPVLDFWQIYPEARFYFVRALEDDMQQPGHGPPHRSIVDFYLVIYRVTEVVSAVLQFSREFGASSENTISFLFRWRGLRGRILGSWSNPMRMLRQQARAHDDRVQAEIEMSADVPESAIPSYVHRIVRQLFLAFQGYELPPKTIEDIAAEVHKRRM